MAIPDVTLNIKDGALGIIGPNTNNQALKLGVFPLGLLNTVQSVSDLASLQTAHGKGGPGVEAAALSLTVAGGPLLCCPVNPSTLGTVSAIVKVGAGAENLTVAAKNAMQILAKVTLGGAVATARLAFSFDGGVTYGADVLSAASLQIPGCSLVTLTITGAGGTSFVLGDIWTITTAGVASLSGTGIGTIAISTASPLDTYNAIVTIVAGGALGTATFNYSLDGGNTVSSTIVVPASGIYVVPDTGLVFTFTGASTAADYFTFTTAAPGFSGTDLTNALTAVFADSRTWFLSHVVGAAASVGAAATLLGTLDTQLTTAANQFRFAAGLVEVPSDTDANTLAAFTTASSTRVGACAGYSNVVSPINGRILSRNAAWEISARLAKVAPSEDAGRVATGSLPGVTKLARDEQATPGLDAGRFSTLRTIIGRNGFYVTNARVMAPAGSDFAFMTNRRVMDIFTAAVRQALLTYLNDSVRVDANTGFILEKDAQAIEKFVEGQCRAVLTQPGYASDLSIAVNRANNILSTQQLQVTARCVPLGYAKNITVDIGFSNPALQLKAA